MTDSDAEDIAAAVVNADEPSTITVVCHHADKTATVSTFTRGIGGRWSNRPHRRVIATDGDIPDARRQSVNATTATVLDGDKQVTGRDIPDNGVRISYDLRCPLCKLHVKVRGERMYKLLDAARHAGINVLTLPAIGTIVS